MASSDPTHVGAIVGPSAWFAIARDVGLDVRALRTSEESPAAPRLAFTVPLTDARGAIRGALIASASLADLKRLFDRSTRNLRGRWGAGVTLDWHLLSPNGELIASTNRQPILGKLALPSAFASAAAAARLPRGARSQPRRHDADGLRAHARTELSRVAALGRC